MHSEPAPPWQPPVGNVAALLRAQVAARGSQPAVTAYDHATGERTELSYATFHNWVAKTANMLVEEFDVGYGDRVSCQVAGHWAAGVIAFACGVLGAVFTTGTPDGARVRFAHESDPGATATDAPTLLVGAGLGGRLSAPRPGAEVFVEEVLAFGDDYDDADVACDFPWLAVADAHALGQRNVMAAADAYAAWGLSDADRLLCGLGAQGGQNVVLTAVAISLGAGVVAVRQPEAGRLWRTMADERVTWAVLDEAALRTLADQGRPPATLRGFIAPLGLPAQAARDAREAFGLPVCVGSGLAVASFAATLLPQDTDATTLAWLDEAHGDPAGVATARCEVAVGSADGAPTAGRRGELAVRGAVVAGAADEWMRTQREAVIAAGPDGREHLFLAD